MLSLKISNIVGNELELILRLKKVNSPGKKVLLNALKNLDYQSIYKELLFRIELYTENKVLNYTRQDLNTIVTSIRNIGVDKIVTELLNKYIPVEQQLAVQQLQLQNQEVQENQQVTGDNLEEIADIVFLQLKEEFESDIEEGKLSGLDALFNEYHDGLSYYDYSNPTDTINANLGNTDDLDEIEVEGYVESINDMIVDKFSDFIFQQTIINPIIEVKEYIEKNSDFVIDSVDEEKQTLQASHFTEDEDGERYVDDTKRLVNKIKNTFPEFTGEVDVNGGRYININISLID